MTARPPERKRIERKRIGVDFDNTIVAYDGVFLAAATERGLLPAEFRGDKQAIRDAIRLLPDGEPAWQRLQGFVYGAGIAAATMFTGVDAFLRRCRREAQDVFVVSHKTEYGHLDPARVNLREAALGWMRRQGLLGADGGGLSVEQVFFESTRADKLRRIALLGCTHFIDDLAEVLSDPEFPPIDRILFSSRAAAPADASFRVCATWAQVEAEVFREHAG
jgi:hypothetical protein